MATTNANGNEVKTIDEVMEENINVDIAILYFSQNKDDFKQILALISMGTSLKVSSKNAIRTLTAAARKICYCNSVSPLKFIKKWIDISNFDDVEDITDAFWAMSYAWVDRLKNMSPEYIDAM